MLGFYSDINEKVPVTKENSGAFDSFGNLDKMAEKFICKVLSIVLYVIILQTIQKGLCFHYARLC